jgi:dienelactone hydrolase
LPVANLRQDPDFEASGESRMTRRTAVGLGSMFALGHLIGLSPEEAAATPSTSAPERGRVRFEPTDDGKFHVPERYRLEARDFPFERTPKFNLRQSGVEVSTLTFPSPVASAIPENNTVHGEYFKPAGDGPFPAVIVLDILDGQQVVGRSEAMFLAQSGVAALVVHMAHYGPRRPAGSRVRLLSTDIPHTMEAIRQTVLDCRCAAAWLASRREVNVEQIGIVGTSLGSFMSALTAASEPRIGRACLLLTGGGLVDAYYDHPRAKPFLPFVDLVGGKPYFQKLIAPADPLTYAEQLKAKKVLIAAASRDDVVPPSAATALWEATGKQKIVWFDATHVGAALYIVPMMRAVIEHVKEA